MSNPLILRLGIVVLAALLTWAIVASVRLYVAAQRRRVLAGAPAEAATPGEASASTGGVRILAFSSEDCSPCHTLQRPALNRLLATREGDVSVVDVDAPSSPELTRRYAVMTVPTTVILDGAGQARAVNYGYAPAEKLLAQVDAILRSTPSASAQVASL